MLISEQRFSISGPGDGFKKRYAFLIMYGCTDCVYIFNEAGQHPLTRMWLGPATMVLGVPFVLATLLLCMAETVRADGVTAFCSSTKYVTNEVNPNGLGPAEVEGDEGGGCVKLNVVLVAKNEDLTKKLHGPKNGTKVSAIPRLQACLPNVAGVVNGPVVASRTVVLAAANGAITEGMRVAGAGIGGGVTVTRVSGTSITLSSAQTIIDQTTLTFTKIDMNKYGQCAFGYACKAAVDFPPITAPYDALPRDPAGGRPPPSSKVMTLTTAMPGIVAGMVAQASLGSPIVTAVSGKTVILSTAVSMAADGEAVFSAPSTGLCDHCAKCTGAGGAAGECGDCRTTFSLNVDDFATIHVDNFDVDVGQQFFLEMGQVIIEAVTPLLIGSHLPGARGMKHASMCCLLPTSA